MMNRIINFARKQKTEVILIIFSVIFSFWLMFATFSYEAGNIQIAGKAWSDFGSHIPLIRSFSFGVNFPPQYPLFSGEPIKYHFLFYSFVGLLEKIGIRIDYALNIPSAIGFAFLLVMIYFFAKYIFKSKSVGVLSVVFFLFNGSLSFLNFFSKHHISWNSLTEITANTNFPSFGPYDHTSIVSAFWNLNIYTNQRHLALSYAFSLFIIYIFLNFEHLVNKKRALAIAILLGIVFGISFILNMAVFLMTGTILTAFLIFMRKERLYIFTTLIISAIIAFPLYKYMNSVPSTFQISFRPGYLVEQLNVFSFLNYWWQNLGLHIILIPVGFFLATKFNKKILIGFFLLFIIGSLFQFSPEIAANHKFFNYFMILGAMFTAFVLVELWKRKKFLKPFVVILFFFLILSGIIDFFPIANDGKIILPDKNDADVQWIIKNTPPDSVFLNTQFFMDKASIAGRKIFFGWPYFAWSQGYDTDSRGKLMTKILASINKQETCNLLKENKIQFVEIINPPDTNVPPVSDIFNDNFVLIYQNRSSDYKIYDTSKTCH